MMKSEEENDIRARIGAYVDGELSDAEAARIEALCRENPLFQRELEACRQAKNLMIMTTQQEPPDAVWAAYWSGVYNRMERKLGWLLFYAGALPIILYVLYGFMEQLLADAALPIWVRIAALIAVAGLVVLFVSLVRERLHLHRNERYREIER